MNYIITKFLGIKTKKTILESSHAILITEFASERRRKGMGIVESAYSAAVVRFRPILMTVIWKIKRRENSANNALNLNFLSICFVIKEISYTFAA